MAKKKDVPEFTGRASLLVGGCCSSLPPGETVARFNREFPTGIRSKWTPLKKLDDGTKLPARCPDHPKTHKHYAFEC